MTGFGIEGTAYGNWPDNRRGLEKALGALCVNANPIVDGTRVGIRGQKTLALSSCAVFLAKNKPTLVHCLREIPLDVTIAAATGQLAFVSHSYDWEKIGGWLRAKIKANKQWSQWGDTDEGQDFIGRGGTKAKFMKRMDRARLMKRGYYLCIANAVDLREHRDDTAIQAERAPLANFGNLVSGQVTREEAVGQLMDDLLIG